MVTNRASYVSVVCLQVPSLASMYYTNTSPSDIVVLLTMISCEHVYAGELHLVGGPVTVQL